MIAINDKNYIFTAGVLNNREEFLEEMQDAYPPKPIFSYPPPTNSSCFWANAEKAFACLRLFFLHTARPIAFFTSLFFLRKLWIPLVLMPVIFYDWTHWILGRFIVVPATCIRKEALQNSRTLIAHNALKKASKDENVVSLAIRRISITVDDTPIDLIQIKNPEAKQGRWTLCTLGNGSCYENALVSSGAIPAAHLATNVLIPNYPNVGASKGFISQKKIEKTVKACLAYLESDHIKAKQIICDGHSLGGGAKALGIHNYPRKIPLVWINNRSFSSLPLVSSAYAQQVSEITLHIAALLVVIFLRAVLQVVFYAVYWASFKTFRLNTDAFLKKVADVFFSFVKKCSPFLTPVLRQVLYFLPWFFGWTMPSATILKRSSAPGIILQTHTKKNPEEPADDGVIPREASLLEALKPLPDNVKVIFIEESHTQPLGDKTWKKIRDWVNEQFKAA